MGNLDQSVASLCESQIPSPKSQMALKSVFLPKWQESPNPYQNQLTAHLAKLGVEVEGTHANVFLPCALGRSQSVILHLQWLHLMVLSYGRTRAIKSSFRLLVFVTQLVILRLIGVKIVWTAHNFKNHENDQLQLDRLCTTIVTRLAHGIIVHCEAAKHELAKEFNLQDLQKIFVVPHGNYVDCYQNDIDQKMARQSLKLPSSSLILLFLGHIRAYKGVVELIAVFKQLPPANLHLVIAGKADQESTELIEQAVQGCENINFLPGFVPEEKLQVYMNAADVVVFPYRDILTSGGVVLAMSFSRACIAPRRGCIGEVLDEAGGFLYDPDQPAGLSQAIDRAIHSRSQLLQMGKYNRQVAEQWNWERIAQMTLNVYQKCLSR